MLHIQQKHTNGYSHMLRALQKLDILSLRQVKCKNRLGGEFLHR